MYKEYKDFKESSSLLFVMALIPPLLEDNYKPTAQFGKVEQNRVS